MNDLDFSQLVLKFDIGFSNHWWYEEFKNQLLEAEDWAFSNSAFLEKKHQLNVKDIYRQIYEFERTIDSITPLTITKTREEGVIFALLSYAEQNRPIIESIFTERTKIFKARQKNFNPKTERIKEILSKTVGCQSDQLAFYMDNYKNEECYSALHNLFLSYMDNLIRLNKYEDYNEFDIAKLEKLPDRYDYGYILHYLKILIRNKDFDTAKKIFTKYPFTPTNKKDTESYESIKKKLGL